MKGYSGLFLPFLSKIKMRTALKLARVSLLLEQQLLSPKRTFSSMVDTTLFDRVVFMIPHHVCFPYLERGWSGWDILIQGQTGIMA